MVKMLIGGDFVVDKPYVGDIDEGLIKLFSESDFNVVNLECPITNAGDSDKIIKTGPYLKGHLQSTKQIFDLLGINLVTLANNHILDYGAKGVLDTLDFCKINSIEAIGAGINKDESAKPFRLNLNGVKISIINIAENEWSSATESSAGSSPMDLIDTLNLIRNEKKEVDSVIVIIHGGHEYYNLPSPRIQKEYRFYAENGANLIIGHHSHCTSGCEIYKGTPIYYSLGNFLFTNKSEFDDWYLGVILELEFKDNGEIRTRTHLVEQDRLDHSLKYHRNSAKLLKRIEEYNIIINDDRLLSQEWKKYVKESSRQYLNFHSPIANIGNRKLRAILHKFKFQFFSKKGAALRLNLMRCEAHSDLSKAVITRFINKEN